MYTPLHTKSCPTKRKRTEGIVAQADGPAVVAQSRAGGPLAKRLKLSVQDHTGNSSRVSHLWAEPCTDWALFPGPLFCFSFFASHYHSGIASQLYILYATVVNVPVQSVGVTINGGSPGRRGHSVAHIKTRTRRRKKLLYLKRKRVISRLKRRCKGQVMWSWYVQGMRPVSSYLIGKTSSCPVERWVSEHCNVRLWPVARSHF